MSTWDEAADFLLDLQPVNLFEGRDATPGRAFLIRCKGCGDKTLTIRDIERHHRAHKKTRARDRERDIKAARERGLVAARKARRRTT